MSLGPEYLDHDLKRKYRLSGREKGVVSQAPYPSSLKKWEQGPLKDGARGRNASFLCLRSLNTHSPSLLNTLGLLQGTGRSLSHSHAASVEVLCPLTTFR